MWGQKLNGSVIVADECNTRKLSNQASGELTLKGG